MKDLLLFVHIDDFAKAQYEFIPLGVLYISSYLSSKGIDVDVVHGTVDDIRPGYKFYGVSTTTAQYSRSLKALKHIRKIQPDAKTILGGPHLNVKHNILVSSKDDWDFLVAGDGELTTLKIVSGKIPPSDRFINGEMVADINALPLPDFSKIDMARYNFPLRPGLKCINIITSRGCPFKCQFCATSQTALRQRTPENVLQEVEVLTSKYGFDSLMFVDDTMSINRKRYYPMLEGLEKYSVKWRSYARTNTINLEGLQRMQRSGCIEAAPGVESGSQVILDLIKKGTNVERNVEFIRQSEDLGIVSNPSLIIGLPGETPETVDMTLQFMKRARPSAFSYNIFLPLPDSPISVNYETFYKQYLTIYPFTWDDCVTKAKKIDVSFVSTPQLSRETIVSEYHKYFDIFVDITGFDPRVRGSRKSSSQ
jgi:anaerobic magnesium-protoporphyrin IX monomethyl ester cyclase